MVALCVNKGMEFKASTAPAAVIGKFLLHMSLIFREDVRAAFEPKVRRPANKVASARGRERPMCMEKR